MLALNEYEYLPLSKVENLAEKSDNYFAWKDKKTFRFLGGSALLGELMLTSTKQLIGLTDFDMNWLNGGHTAEYFNQTDKQVMAGRSITNAREMLLKANAHGEIVSRIVIVSKRHINHNGHCVGVAFESKDITQSILPTLDLKATTQNTYPIKFTPKERACIKFLLCGHSYQRIGEKLYISSRTVEYHFEKIRDKLNCRNKQALIDKLLKMGYKPAV